MLHEIPLLIYRGGKQVQSPAALYLLPSYYAFSASFLRVL